MDDMLTADEYDGWRQRIQRHEGCRLTPYRDTRGLLTVGYGHLLERPISQVEAEQLFDADFEAAHAASLRIVPAVVSPARRGVLVEMCFQLGERGVRRFRRMLAAVAAEDWNLAADEMLDSRWARQTPERCRSLAEIMRNGR